MSDDDAQTEAQKIERKLKQERHKLEKQRIEEEKQKRLQEALRQNLRRRKTQSKTVKVKDAESSSN